MAPQLVRLQEAINVASELQQIQHQLLFRGQHICSLTTRTGLVLFLHEYVSKSAYLAKQSRRLADYDALG